MASTLKDNWEQITHYKGTVTVWTRTKTMSPHPAPLHPPTPPGDTFPCCRTSRNLYRDQTSRQRNARNLRAEECRRSGLPAATLRRKLNQPNCTPAPPQTDDSTPWNIGQPNGTWRPSSTTKTTSNSEMDAVPKTRGHWWLHPRPKTKCAHKRPTTLTRTPTRTTTILPWTQRPRPNCSRTKVKSTNCSLQRVRPRWWWVGDNTTDTTTKPLL